MFALLLFATLQQPCPSHARLSELRHEPLDVHFIARQRHAGVPTGKVDEFMERTLGEDEIETARIPQGFGLRGF